MNQENFKTKGLIRGFDKLSNVHYYVHIITNPNYMNAKTTLSISEARKKIFDLAGEVQKPGIYYTFTEKGRPKAVLMSAEEFESWQETLEVMNDFPDLKEDIKEAEQAYVSGEYKNWLTLEQLLAKEGFVVSNKASQKYGVSNQSQAKRAKRVGKTA